MPRKAVSPRRRLRGVGSLRRLGRRWAGGAAARRPRGRRCGAADAGARGSETSIVRPGLGDDLRQFLQRVDLLG